MDLPELQERLDRLHACIGEVASREPEALEPTVSHVPPKGNEPGMIREGVGSGVKV